MVVWLLTPFNIVCFDPENNQTFRICLSSQEDDIEGIHIVAFAEEEDPGKSRLKQIQ